MWIINTDWDGTSGCLGGDIKSDLSLLIHIVRNQSDISNEARSIGFVWLLCELLKLCCCLLQ